MTDGQLVAIMEGADEWVDVGVAATRLGFDAGTILRLIQEGALPAIQIAGRARTAHRLPRRLIDEAYAAVMAGGQVELREFARQWSARNAVPGAVA
jgi:hypothetical protein